MLEFKKFENGFSYVEIGNASASAKIAFQGAHLFHYERKNEKPLLWLSKSSDFEVGKAIRGGVPICWPSFGMNNSDLPQHGFARVGMWKLKNSIERDEETTQATFVLRDTDASRGMWNYKFELELKITIGKKLIMQLITTNKDEKSFKLTQALHTYFAISDISNIMIKGLNKKPYLDTLTNKQKKQKGKIKFKEEMDRVYQEVDGEILLKDKMHTTHITNKGSSSVVIWNPWKKKCKKMSAMSNEAYKEFVCIESANAYDDFRVLQPNESHTMGVIID